MKYEKLIDDREEMKKELSKKIKVCSFVLIKEMQKIFPTVLYWIFPSLFILLRIIWLLDKKTQLRCRYYQSYTIVKFKDLEDALEVVNNDQKKLQQLHKKLQQEFEEKKQISENKEVVSSWLSYLIYLSICC